jgi:amino acid adenylation domain-containing protein
MLAEKLPPAEGEDEILAFPLSFAQQRLWFLDQLYPGNVAYNVPFAVRIVGDLDVPTLAVVFAALVERHEPLRTTFATIGSEPVQVVSDSAPVPVPCIDLRGLAPGAREEETRRLAREEARLPFDLRRGPLLRAMLLRTGDLEHLLLLSQHHIVCDGWSVGVLLADVAALYEPIAAGLDPELPELPIQYADFALWQRDWLQGEALESRLAYWREQLADAPGLLELPTDRPRPAAPGFEGRTVRFSFPEELSRRALALAAELRCSPFMLLLAAFDALLYRYTGQEDVLLGTPVANRNWSDLEPLIGFFVNTLVLRARPRPDLSFAALAEEVRAAALEAFARQDVPFEKLLEELQPERSASVTPLFQIMLVFQNAPAGRLEIPGLKLEGVPVESETSKLDLTLHLAEEEGRLRGALVYRAELFDAPTVRRLAAHLETLLAGAVADPLTSLADLPLLSPAERQQAVVEWNDSGSPDLSGRCVHELFEEQAARDPGAPALVFEGERLTRGELDAGANRLAWRLRELGVVPEVPVGLCLERSAGSVVALLAVLKAGGTYLPLEPALPAERLRYMLELSGAPVLVTRGGLAARLQLSAPTVLDLDEVTSGREDDPPRTAGPGNLAYVLFTSGSTGRPKGVAVEHRHLLAYLAGVGERLRVPAGGSYATVSTLAADLGNTAIFPALCLGGCLHVLAEDRLADPEAMEAYFRREEIDCLKIVPSHLAVLPGTLPRRELVLGGEVSHWEEVERIRSGSPWLGILNHYGPTEATVGVLTFRVPAGRPGRHGRLPLGRPLAGARVHLLDRSGNPVPAGVAGELHIGGASLTRGYLHRPDLTAEQFVPNPFGEPGGRLYRTGDLARRLADGLVDFVGRADDQLKLRGYRVEPGEIEAVLAEHPAVRAATVQIRGGRLVAWIVADCAAAELRGYLQGRLPAYMVPAAFVPLEKIPLTAQGKVDRRALPDAESVPRECPRVPPRTPVEAGVAAIWSEVLGVEEIGVHDSFFDLGGHSLLAAQAASRLRRAFQVDLPLRTLFEAPTVAGLAGWIEGASGRARPPLVPLPRPAGRAAVFPVSFAQQRLWFLDRLEPGSAFYNIPRALRLEGDLNPAALGGAFQALVDRHESLRTTFAEGPIQVVAPARRHELTVVDLSGLPSREEEVRRLAAEEAVRPFDLERGPLLRTVLIRQSFREHVLLLTLHHIVSDAWSAGVLLREMAALFAGEPLSRLPVQVADVAVWQRQRLQGEELEAQIAAWRRLLAGAPPVLELPTDRPRPPLQSYRGANVWFELPPWLSKALRELSARERATPFMALLAAFAALLFRYTGETDLCIGTPVAGRTEVETEGLIGFFVNTLVIRADLSGEPSFRELLGRVRDRSIEAQAWQDFPFEKLVEELAPERSLSHSPLFQVMVGLVNLPMALPPFGGLALTHLGVETPIAKFDLSLSMLERPGGFSGSLEYASDLFHGSTALRMLEHFRALLEDMVRQPKRGLSEAALLGEAERQQLLVEWNDTAAADPAELRIHRLFATQAERTPDAAAVVRGEAVLTFRELQRRAGCVAEHLSRRGVGPELLVGIHMERTPELIVALLAVLEAGGAYVPLDPSYPEDRLRWIREDARLDLTLDREAVGELNAPAEAGRRPASEAGPANLAYVLYTSGSTGLPKGVAVTHSSAGDYLYAVREVFPAEDRERVLASSSLNSDPSVLEIFLPLCWGGTVVLVDDALGLASLPDGGGVTLISTVPSAFTELLEAGAVPPTVRTVGLGGEVLRQDLADRIHGAGAGWRLVNEYGPTEDTVDSTMERVEPGTAPTIGRPVRNTRAHVLDRAFRPVPIGVSGELFLGGNGHARGFLGRPDLTAERFVPDPCDASPGARLYRTGDRIRYLPDGRLDFLGRLDQQVKVRGFRIELGEVEAALTGHPEVREATVVEREAGLVAYVAGSPEPDVLRSHLEGLLPGYMVPQRFVFLDALPRTPNGKVDRRALPEPAAVSGTAGFAPPRTPREELLAWIWEEVLGVERIGRHDHFFDLGGHSLLAVRVLTRVREAFRVELPLRTLFQAPTLAELASRIGEGTAPAEPILPVPRDRRLPLSFAQQRLWFLHQLEPGSQAYNMLAHLRLSGALSAPALEAALAEVVRRHEVLRTRYALADEEPVQVPEPFAPFLLPLVDLAALPEEARRAEAGRLAREEACRPFDLGQAPVLRALLARLDYGEHALVVSVHHVAADGWSLEILAREVAALYADSPLPALPIQVADFAAWQRRRPLDAHLAWWRERLAGAPPLLALPTDSPRPALWSGRGAGLQWRMAAPRAAAVQARFRESGATLFMGLLAAFQALLQRWSGADDVVVGTPVSGRPTVETEALIGCFVNTLVLRGDLSGRPSARDLLTRSRSAVLDAHAHQELPFEALVEALAPERSLSHAPLFQVLLTVEPAARETVGIPGLALGLGEVDAGSAKFDLHLTVTDADGALQASLEYATDLFDVITAHRLLDHLERLLDGFATRPDLPVAELPLLSEAELHQALAELDCTEAPFPEECLHWLFEARAAEQPESIALSWQGTDLTCAELNGQANRLARHLRSLGVGPEVRVEVCLDRTPDLAVALLAVLKAGGAYVPLDPAWPAERLRAIAAQSEAPVLLTRAGIEAPAEDRLRIEVGSIDPWPEEDLEGGALPDTLAYVIYTSGSTGVPKGVAIEHRATAALLRWAREVFRPEDLAGVLASTSVCFDLSVFELFAPLAWGGRVVLVQDALRLAELPPEAGVTLVNTVPSAIDELLRLGSLPATVRTVSLAGEPLERALVARVPRGMRVLNFYGPSEDTTYSTWEEVPRDGEPTIGRPVAGTRACLLDAALQPVPPGVPGELFLGGAGSARGYLGRPDLTAASWMPDPFGPPGARLYRTGDLARLRRDGRLEFLGRRDHQVKVRGFRIELGEVEAALAYHPGVDNAVVVAQGTSADRRLVAYVVGRDEGLRAWLQERLPSYMVPSAFVVLDVLPLSPNGKVDRKALPEPGPTRPQGGVPPRDELERRLAAVWEDLLEVRPVGVRDDFFELGGHSLLAVRLLARMRRETGRDLPLSALFQRSTVEGLAALLREGEERARSPLVAIRPEGALPPLFCVHPVGGNVLCYRELGRHLARPLYALEYPGYLLTVEAMAERYLEAVREVRPRGSYHLAGWSSGGVIAFEMARRLAEAGEEVELALLDTFAPAVVPAHDDTEILLIHAWALGFSYEELATLPEEERLRRVLDRLPEDLGIAQVRRHLEVYRIILEAVRAYVPRPYPGRMLLVRCAELEDYGEYAHLFGHGPADPAPGWSGLARRLEVRDVRATHNQLVQEPAVAELASILA